MEKALGAKLLNRYRRGRSSTIARNGGHQLLNTTEPNMRP
jgi:hypothetical protein